MTQSVYETRGVDFSQMQTLTEIGTTSRSGQVVSEQSALGISSVWCGVRVISEAIGSLPLALFETDESGARTRTTSHPLCRLFRSPNPEMTRPVFFETLQAHALLWGSAFAEIERDASGRPVALWPCHPRNVQCVRDESGRLAYRVTTTQAGLSSTVIPSANMLCVPGLSPDGTIGYRLLTLARNTLGFALAAQSYGESFFKNMARPGGALEVPNPLSDVARENLRRSWQSLHSGDGVGTTAILEEGVKFTAFVNPNNEQTQYKELLSYFVYEVARLLNLQPTKLHSLEKGASWANLETLNQDFLTTTLVPWLEKYEAEFERKLLLPSEEGQYTVEFLTDRLLRANIAARYTSYSQALNCGWLSVNEVRAKEGLAAVDGGNAYRFPLNMGVTPTVEALDPDPEISEVASE